jgi:hypothetical protein
MSNGLRMPFVEWLYRMSNAGLSIQARMIAIHAACFDVTGTKELGDLCGIKDERTVRKWKSDLYKLGWVIIGQKGGGRGHGIKIHAALRGVPVEFTDIKPKNPDTLCIRLARETLSQDATHCMQNGGTQCQSFDAERGAPDVRVSDQTPARDAPISGETLAADAGVSKESFPHTPFKENNNINNLPLTQKPASASEEILGHGVVVNCETIRHANFTISIPGVALRCQASGLSTAEIKSKLTGIALQWAAEIEGGKKPKDVLPLSMNSALARAVMGDRFQEDVHAMRKGRAGKATPASDAQRQIDAIVGRRP